MVDLSIFLNEMLTYDNVTVKSDNSSGRSQYILQGHDNIATKELTILIDQESKKVTHLEFSIYNQQFAEIDFEYQDNIEGYSLPSKILLHHFTDDSRAELTFLNYNFTK